MKRGEEMEKLPMTNNELDELMRKENIPYELRIIIRWAVFSGMAQSYTVEQKKVEVESFLRNYKVELKRPEEKKK